MFNTQSFSAEATWTQTTQGKQNGRNERWVKGGSKVGWSGFGGTPKVQCTAVHFLQKLPLRFLQRLPKSWQEVHSFSGWESGVACCPKCSDPPLDQGLHFRHLTENKRPAWQIKWDRKHALIPSHYTIFSDDLALVSMWKTWKCSQVANRRSYHADEFLSRSLDEVLHAL